VGSGARGRGRHRHPGAFLGLASGLILAGCSASPSGSGAGSGTHPHVAPPVRATTSTSSTVPPVATTTTTAPPIQATAVQILVSGASATLEFPTSSLTGTVSPGQGAFSQGGTVYSFVVSGVSYSGPPTTKPGNGGLIGSVQVASGSGGAVVTVHLSGPASHAALGEGHAEVGVQFS